MGTSQASTSPRRSRRRALAVIWACSTLNLGAQTSAPTYDYTSTSYTVLGASAGLAAPAGMVVDAAGNLYIADSNENVIRVLSTGGTLAVFAGQSGSAGSADGTGSAARFSSPSGLAIDSAGNIYVADTGNDAIRKITPAGVVTTFAGTPGQVGATDGTASAALFNGPQGICADSSGNLYVTDTGNNTVRLVDPSGTVTTLAGQPGVAGAADGAGAAAQFSGPTGVALAPDGELFVTDTGNDTIRTVSPAGLVTTEAGVAGQAGTQDGIGTAARFSAPTGIAVEVTGLVVIADTGNDTMRILFPTSLAVWTVAGSAGTAGVADGTGASALFSSPGGLTYDAGQNVIFVADAGNHQVLGLTSPVYAVPYVVAQSTTSMIAAGQEAVFQVSASYNSSLTPSYQWMLNDVPVSGATDSYLIIPAAQVSDAGVYTCAVTWGSVSAVSNPLTLKVNPEITFASQVLIEPVPSGPNGIAVDTTGNVYVTMGNAVAKWSAGTLTLVAGSFQNSGWVDGAAASSLFAAPTGLAVDAFGTVYVADSGNNRVRTISPGGMVATLAGSTPGSADGVGSAAQFQNPVALAVGSNGTILVADAGNNELRSVQPDGTVSTLLLSTAITALGGPGNGRFAITGVAFDNNSFPVIAATNVLDPSEAGDGQVALGRVTAAGVATGFAQLGSAAPADTFGPLANDAAGDLFTALGNWIWFDAPAYSTALDYVQATFSAQALAIGPDGTIYGTDPSTNSVVTLTPSAAFPAPPSAGFTAPLAAGISGGTTTVAAPPPSRVANLSSRALVGAGAQVEIAGFVIAGDARSTKEVLIRAVGTGLAQYGVGGVLQHPRLTLLDAAANALASNVGWSTANNANAIAAAAGATGAFPLAPGSADSALLVSLPPGAYTAEISGADGGTGIALAEVYETTADSLSLVNISTRAYVGAGAEAEIAGIAIHGSLPKQVLIRAVGPSLAQFQVAGALAAPTLTVVDASGQTVATNAGWSANPSPAAIAAAAAAVGAFPLPEGSLDCSLLLTLAPGNYTATVTGGGSLGGIALVEVYQQP